MNTLYKIKAQAMQFALLISVIIAMVLSAFLLLTHVQSFFRIKSKKLINATELASNKLLEAIDDAIISTDTIVSSDDAKTLKLITNYHGVWSKTVSEVTIKNRKIAKTAFSGAAIDQKTPNLYLANKNAPLVVVGATRLEGNSYLPKQGVKAGNISGNYYQGSSLYYGKAIESKDHIPTLDPSWISYIELLTKGSAIQEDQVIPLEKLVENSFYKPSKIIYNSDAIILGNEKVSGNIIVQSASKITITAASELTDVLLIAPTIVVQNNVKGRFQLIATKKIEIGQRCVLSYPSSITLMNTANPPSTNQQNRSQDKTSDLMINENTIIEGAVVYFNKNQGIQNRIKTNIKVESNVIVTGEIYCKGNVEFLGTVKGSLYAQQFIANQSGSVYLNHLYNGQILRNPVADYAGLPFANTKKNVVQWLY